jgi:hypothetical protein
VTAELVRYVHLEIMIPVAEQLNWQSERGSEMWRRSLCTGEHDPGVPMIRIPRVLWALWLVALYLVSGAAHAATVTVSWTNPTQYEDGSSLPASDIERTRIEYGTCNGQAFGNKLGEFTANGAATTATSPNLSPGTYCFRAYTRAKGLESQPSAPVQKTILQPPPKPPTNLQVAEQTVYTSVKRTDRLVMLPVGTVPGDTVCIATEGVIVDGVTYHAVPRAAVQWSGSVQPDIAYARCT